jgi:hypothetical protein
MTFCTQAKLVETTGLSPRAIKKYRLSSWEIGIHFQRMGHNTILYNLPLILDWIANRHQPELHAIAVRNYLKELPSSRR